MQLRVLAPTHIEFEGAVDKVCAEGLAGSFCILPRHVDWVTGLAPGLLLYERDAREGYLAVNGGILTKCGDVVTVSTLEAVQGESLERLREQVDESFRKLSEREERARIAISKVEADFVRRLIELEEHV